MTLEIVRTTLAWCSVMNLVLLAVWAIGLHLAHDFVFRVHGRLFNLSVERFDAIHYSGMLAFKLCIFVFNIVPYLALRLFVGG